MLRELLLPHRRRQRGLPREIEKLLYKNDVISEGSIFSNNFQKIAKIHFSIEFASKISQLFSRIWVCLPDAQKINKGFLENNL